MQRLKTVVHAARPILAVLAVTLSFAAPCAAQESVPLLRAVPADVHFYTHDVATQTPDREMLAVSRAMASLCESGIHRDIIALVTIESPPSQRDQIVAMADEAFRLLGTVDWKRLTERESAFAFRLGVPMPEYLLLFRVSAESAPTHVAAIRDLLSGLIGMTGMEPLVQEVDRASGKMTIVGLDGVPIQICLGIVGDAIVLATSVNMGASAMAKLAGGTDDGSILSSEAARAATGGLPERRNGVEYVDVDSMMSFVGQMLGMVGSFMPNDGSKDSAIAREMLGLGLAALQDLNVVDSVATSYASDKNRSTMTTRMACRPEAAQSRLAAVTASQRPWSDWARRVPKNATSFTFSPGINLTALYDWGLALVKENLSIQEEVLAKWDAIQTDIGFRLRDDLLVCISGESATISFPALPNGSATGESVTFMRLEQPDRVAAKLKSLLDASAAYVASRGHKVELVAQGGLTELKIGPLPWFKPVVGVLGDELVIASSAAAVAKIDAVSRGAEPNILTDPRFSELGVGTRPGVTSVGYWSVDASPEPVADMLGTIGFVYTLFPERSETRSLIIMGNIFCKLSTAIREFDFRYDRAYETSVAQDGAIESVVVTRYR